MNYCQTDSPGNRKISRRIIVIDDLLQKNIIRLNSLQVTHKRC